MILQDRSILLLFKSVSQPFQQISEKAVFYLSKNHRTISHKPF